MTVSLWNLDPGRSDDDIGVFHLKTDATRSSYQEICVILVRDFRG